MLLDGLHTLTRPCTNPHSAGSSKRNLNRIGLTNWSWSTDMLGRLGRSIVIRGGTACLLIWDKPLGKCLMISSGSLLLKFLSYLHLQNILEDRLSMAAETQRGTMPGSGKRNGVCERRMVRWSIIEMIGIWVCTGKIVWEHVEQ